jgi:hypothetical protein
MMALQRSHFCQGKFVRGSRSGEQVKDHWLIRSGMLEVIGTGTIEPTMVCGSRVDGLKIRIRKV